MKASEVQDKIREALMAADTDDETLATVRGDMAQFVCEISGAMSRDEFLQIMGHVWDFVQKKPRKVVGRA